MAFCINANPVVNKCTHQIVSGGKLLMGCLAGFAGCCGNYSVMIGYYAGAYNCGNQDVIIGYCALPCGASTLGGDNVAVGFRAGTGGCRHNGNVYIGDSAFAPNTYTTTECSNTFVGNYAGWVSTASCEQTGIGYLALGNTAGKTRNIGIGKCAGCGTVCNHNVVIGPALGTAFTTDGNLHIAYSGGAIAVCGTRGNCIGFGAPAPTPAVRVHVTGAIGVTGEIIAYYSDRRLKENIILIDCALDKVTKLNGVKYNSNKLAETFGFDPTKDEVGLIADEVENEIPEVVKLAPFDYDENRKSKSGENYKTIQYERLVPYLVESIKELNQIVLNLEKEWEIISEEEK